MTDPTTPPPGPAPLDRPIRWVALGDSMNEGVGDPDPARPNGVRGWADLVAEQLTAAHPDTRYANLAVRGRLLRGIVEEQLEPCLALEPTLVSLYAGGNDMLRPTVDVDALMEVYDRAVARLRSSGAQVVLFTAFDPGRDAPTSWTRPRQALYNEHVREIAERHGCLLLDYWRMRALQDWRYWAVDRLRACGRLDCLLDNGPSPNGLALSPDEDVLFVAMTRDNAVWRLPLLPDGSTAKVGRFASFHGTSGPDGMAVDAAGNLLVAHASLGSVFVLSPQGEPVASGESQRTHDLRSRDTGREREGR